MVARREKHPSQNIAAPRASAALALRALTALFFNPEVGGTPREQAFLRGASDAAWRADTS
jgi:hypothetical protein